MLGLDYSGVAGNTAIDFNEAYRAGSRFLYLRAYQRLVTREINDPVYARDAGNARKAGLAVGAYFFPSWHVKAPTPKTQVQAFKAATLASFDKTKKQCVLNGGGTGVIPGKDLPPALDVESKDWTASGHSKRELAALMEIFVRELEDQFGCRPVIYTSFFQWEALGAPAAPWIANCPLWIKTAYIRKARSAPVSVEQAGMLPHLGYARAVDPKNYRRVPDPWNSSSWAVNQYQGDVVGFSGFNGLVDLNRFNVSKIGSQGPFVRWIQRSLELKDDGDFGSITDKSVRAFQKMHGLLVDGEVGVRTFAALAWS